jgi:hypothetical protein
MIVLFALLFSFCTVFVVYFWSEQFGCGFDGIGLIIIGLLSFAASILFQLFAPEEWKFPVLCVAMGILMITLLVNIITSRKK